MNKAAIYVLRVKECAREAVKKIHQRAKGGVLAKELRLKLWASELRLHGQFLQNKRGIDTIRPAATRGILDFQSVGCQTVLCWRGTEILSRSPGRKMVLADQKAPAAC
jgi:hypothetical protein